jgi:choline kinase
MIAVLLAAGKGSRLGDKNYNPKSLFSYKNKTLLERLIQQLKKNKIKNINIVLGYKHKKIKQTLKKIKSKVNLIENKYFAKDTNIYSVFLGLSKLDDDILILETDCVFDETSFKKIIKSKNTTWFTLGKFKKDQVGGILKKNKKNEVKDLRIVKKYNTKFKDYLKLTGVLYLSKKDLQKYKILIKEYLKKGMKYYYLQPFIDNLRKFKSYSINLNEKTCFSFNTLEDFRKFSSDPLDKIEYIKVKDLRHIEGFGVKKVKNLKKKIIQAKYWNAPIKVDHKYNLVMDGQHRMEVAKELGLKYVPCVRYNYRKIKIWSLRPKSYKVSVNKIFKNFHENKIFPYKTVKHFFPNNEIIKCKVEIKKLKNMK